LGIGFLWMKPIRKDDWARFAKRSISGVSTLAI
jgi:hypothetical protein